MGHLFSQTSRAWVERVASNLVQQIAGSNLKAQLIRGMGGTFLLRVMNTAVKFLTSFLLARLLGRDGFGVYNFATAWITLLIVPALFGFERLLVRELAVYRRTKNWSLLRGLMRFANRLTLVLSLVMVALAGLIAWVTYETTGRPAMLQADKADFALLALYTLLLALLLVPLRAFLLMQQAAMQGLRRVVTSQVPEQIIQPVLMLGIVAGLYLFAGRVESPALAMAIQIGTTLFAVVYSMALFRKMIPYATKTVPAHYQIRPWVYASIPFFLNKELNALNAQVDTLLLGAMTGADSVALYVAALRGTQLIGVLLNSVNVALAPNIAHLFVEKDKTQLQRILTQSARFALAGALPLTLLLIVFGKSFLDIFGSEFTGAYTALVILSVGQLINVVTGPTGVLLMMTNYERVATASLTLGVVLDIGLNIVLIPRWGIEGAAVAKLVSTSVANTLNLWMAWKRLHLHSTILGPLRWGREA
jgi:O-antigen/teichoic acid export membrane protein